MLLNSYSIYDNKALVYAAPFFAINDGHAVRSFSDLANDLNTTVGRHPGDFSLYCIGSFSDSNGSLEVLVPLRHVVDAMGLVAQQPRLPFTDTGGKRGDELANGEDR